MNKHEDLEKKLGEENSGLEETLEIEYEPATTTRKDSPLRNYVVDTTAAWLYWTPLMTVTETISGMESEEIFKSRLMSLCVHAFLGRPNGMFRQYWANTWNADAESSPLKKFAVDTSAQVCFQVPIYSTMLYFSGASFKEGITALTTGVAVGILSGRGFGYVQDKWRKLWGTKPTLDE